MATAKSESAKKRVRKPKTDNGKRQQRKKDTPDLVSKALLSYSSARILVEQADVHSRGEIPDEDARKALKFIRDAQNGVKASRATIDSLRKTTWRETMLGHLEQWEELLDSSWDNVIDAI